jgi:hypothetical protein
MLHLITGTHDLGSQAASRTRQLGINSRDVMQLMLMSLATDFVRYSLHCSKQGKTKVGEPGKTAPN